MFGKQTNENHYSLHMWAVLVCLSLLLTGCNLASGPQSATPTYPSVVVVVATQTSPPVTPTATDERIITISTPTEVSAGLPLNIESQLAPINNPLMGTNGLVYLRDNPSTMSQIASSINQLATWQFIGRTADNRWLQIELSDGRKGWLMVGSVIIDTPIDSLPVTGQPDNTSNVLLLPARMTSPVTLYRQPEGEALEDLGVLTPVRVDGRSGDNAWFLVTTNHSLQGWISSSGLDVPFVLEQIPAVEVPRAWIPIPTPIFRNGARVNFVENAFVRDDAGGLRLRQLPSSNAEVFLNMDAGTPLAVSGRTADNQWALVEMKEGYLGWTAAQYLDIKVDLSRIDVISNPQPVPFNAPAAPASAPSVSTGGGGNAHAIYQRGQQMGNRRNVFTTIGDSLTDTSYFLRPIFYGYDLGDYGYLLPVLQYFNSDTGQGNAYNRRSISAHSGWSTFSALDPKNAAPGVCQSQETPIECEYRLTKPAVALIMIGTNDSPAFPASTYRQNMTRIVDISSQYGVVPVLSTLPPRGDEFNSRILEYNQVIRQLAAARGLPLWDFYNAAVNLPGGGLDTDGIHLSIPPGAPAATAAFSEDNLRYGTTMRNLTALQMLDTVWKQVLN